MKNQTQALEHASIQQYCKAEQQPTVAADFVSLAEQAVKENHDMSKRCWSSNVDTCPWPTSARSFSSR